MMDDCKSLFLKQLQELQGQIFAHKCAKNINFGMEIILN